MSTFSKVILATLCLCLSAHSALLASEQNANPSMGNQLQACGEAIADEVAKFMEKKANQPRTWKFAGDKLDDFNKLAAASTLVAPYMMAPSDAADQSNQMVRQTGWSITATTYLSNYPRKQLTNAEIEEELHNGNLTCNIKELNANEFNCKIMKYITSLLDYDAESESFRNYEVSKTYTLRKITSEEDMPQERR